MRRGEILSLRWEHIDFKSKLIRVEKTKSKRNRFIPINTLLQGTLLQLESFKNGSPYVFPNPKTKRPFSETKTAFNAAKRRAEISNLRFHDLRHTFASRLIAAGVDIITVMNLLGHHSVSVTQRYTHSNEVQKRQAVEALSRKTGKIVQFVPTVSTREEEGQSTSFISIN